MIPDYENGVRGRIIRAVHHYAEANNKCTFNYDETKEISYFVLILAINTDGLYQNNFLMAVLNMLKICQCLHLILS